MTILHCTSIQGEEFRQKTPAEFQRGDGHELTTAQEINAN